MKCSCWCLQRSFLSDIFTHTYPSWWIFEPLEPMIIEYPAGWFVINDALKLFLILACYSFSVTTDLKILNDSLFCHSWSYLWKKTCLMQKHFRLVLMNRKTHLDKWTDMFRKRHKPSRAMVKARSHAKKWSSPADFRKCRIQSLQRNSKRTSCSFMNALAIFNMWIAALVWRVHRNW